MKKSVEDGWVIKSDHPSLPLFLFSYSRATVREQHWDDVTMKCRGLIIHDSGDIISRPFVKFFNFEDGTRPETLRANLPKTAPVITDKLDGSLGIFYQCGDYKAVASKGSFTSPHAQWATKTYNRLYSNARWPEGYTPIFEMICQDVQTHVVRYNTDYAGLHLLALIKNDTGEEMPVRGLHIYGLANNIKVVKHFSEQTLESVAQETLQTQRHQVRKGFYEGYVIAWPRAGQTPLRVKVKTIQFLRLQRLLHHTRPKHVLQALRDPAFRPLLNDWLHEQEAPQFVEFVQLWKNKLETAYKEIELQSCLCYDTVVNELGPGATRKDFALQFKEHPYAPVLFAMLPGKDFEQQSYGKVIWKLLEPTVHDLGPVSEEEE